MEENLSLRISNLEKHIPSEGGQFSKLMECFDIYIACCIVIPIITFSYLYFCIPSLVQKDGKRDIKKVVLYTLLISSIVWGMYYFFKKDEC